ncbi:hypothetical protein CRG98_044121 [Punica granatum]|uniref:Uncharacterized protein n=1 Tax=Punica granatum TaxID=22663 RepID=A0A2I0HUY3_PUNGR|nr:hypothetical protein CRG98_044121 [Punica granatum]
MSYALLPLGPHPPRFGLTLVRGGRIFVLNDSSNRPHGSKFVFNNSGDHTPVAAKLVFNDISLSEFESSRSNSKLSYASAMTKGAQVELTGPAILGAELLTMIKQMAQLEERMVSQSKKEAGMPTDKKQMLSSAMSRTEPLEEPKSYFHD